MTGFELILGVVVYLLPAVVAYRRHTFNRASVLIVDVFLGWTFVGWVVALAMAASGRQEPITTITKDEPIALPQARGWLSNEDLNQR